MTDKIIRKNFRFRADTQAALERVQRHLGLSTEIATIELLVHQADRSAQPLLDFDYNRDYDAEWAKVNNAGDGYAVGEEDEGANEVDELLAKGYKLRIPSRSDDRVAVYHNQVTGEVVAVGDANGPWACDL